MPALGPFSSHVYTREFSIVSGVDSEILDATAGECLRQAHHRLRKWAVDCRVGPGKADEGVEKQAHHHQTHMSEP